jgi:hypothetical protein
MESTPTKLLEHRKRHPAFPLTHIMKQKGDSMDRSIPKWTAVVSVLITMLGLFVGFSLYLSPGTFVKNIDFSAAGTHYLASMWAARQISIAAIIGFSLFRRSAVMLTVALIAYCLMTFQDVLIGVSLSDVGLITGSSFGCILSASMIYTLTKKNS